MLSESGASYGRKSLGKPRVLLDTNILVSGLVFAKGNEHEILRLVEDRRVTAVLAETVLIEAKQVLNEKFPGFERLLDLFPGGVEFETVSLSEILPVIDACRNKVADGKDAPIYAAVAITKPDCIIRSLQRVPLKSNRRAPRLSWAERCQPTEPQHAQAFWMHAYSGYVLGLDQAPRSGHLLFSGIPDPS